MTPDKNFRMKQATKIMVALFKGNAESRNGFKRAMIEAQLCEEAAKRAALKSNDNKDKTPRGVSRGAVAPE